MSAMDVRMGSPPRQPFVTSFGQKRSRSPSVPQRNSQFVDTSLLSLPTDDLGRTVKRLRLDSRSTSASSRSRSKSPGPSPLAAASGFTEDKKMVIGGGSNKNVPAPQYICAEPETGSSSSSSASSSAYYLPYYPQASLFQDENQNIHASTSLYLNPAMTAPLDSSLPFRPSFNDSIRAAPFASATHFANAGYCQSSILSRARPVTPPLQPPSFSSSEATMVDEDDVPDSEMVLYASQVPLPTSPSRRLKVSMGPRAGCERCRLKVPGHWMHMRE